MKKTAKIIGSALAVLLAITFIVSCDTGTNSEDDDNPNTPTTVLTDEFDTYYLNIADAGLSGLEGFHLKNKSGAPIGIVIDRIFAATAKSTAGAVDVFTFSEPESGTNYWGFSVGTIANGAWSSGEVEAPAGEETEVYITGFATSTFVDATYVGIVAKNLSSTISGDDMTFVPIITDPKPELEKTFKEFFSK